MALHSDWKEFLSLLNRNKVRFVVVGAHALAAHGQPRFTGDLDVLVEPTPANAVRVLAALRAFGFGSCGVSFTTAWKNRLKTVLGGVAVGVLSHRDFVRNKRAAGRTKDLLDVALLQSGRRAR